MIWNTPKYGDKINHSYHLGKTFKITTQGNYVTLIIICHEHQNKLKYIL